jgi:hypothetical protein
LLMARSACAAFGGCCRACTSWFPCVLLCILLGLVSLPCVRRLCAQLLCCLRSAQFWALSLLLARSPLLVCGAPPDGLASQPRHYRVPGQPLLNRHQVGGVSRSPDGLFAQQERQPIRGRPAVIGKRAYGGRPGQCMEEQGTWASHTQKHSEAGYGRPVNRGAWTAKTVKRPRQQPAHPQYANYWAPLTCKRHTMPHSAQPQRTNYWALQMRKRHQQEHRPQRPTESSDPTQHAKGRTGDCPEPCKGTSTRRNVTQGGANAGARASAKVGREHLERCV